MSSSLSEQLKRLAVPQTTLLQRDKKRASLLFDPKEAAGLKRETVYQIGLDGLEELIGKNQVFEQFKNNLFHITSKKFERSIETAESNRKLDKVIRKFLLQLSPYFLLNCSHKALEWLINRYSIHEFNREDLLMTIMPYHESNIFVRVVQLMKFREHNDNWFFLKSLQKPGVHLTKQNLLNHAANDVAFIKFVAKFISLLIKNHEKPSLLTVAFNFYCTTFAGALEYTKQINEAQVTQMLPTLLRGLNSDIPDYCAASYIILGRLVTKTPLTDAVLDKFVERIADAKVETLKTEMVLILLVLYQSQNHYDIVPDEAVARLAEKQWLPKTVQDLGNSNCYVTPFLKALVRSCLYGAVNLDQEIQRDFMKSLLGAIKFEDSFMEIFLSLLLDGTKQAKKQYPEHIQKWLTEIIETLERQYPDQYDKEVYKILSTAQQGKTVIKRRKSLQKILKETMTVRCKFDVLDKLYHPNVAYRREALQYLASNYDSLRDREKEMIKSSFIDRLNDDDISVVQETLTLIKKISVLNPETIKNSLVELAFKCQKDLKTWAPVSTEIVKTLCGNSKSSDWVTFLAVFPYLLPNSEDQLRAAKAIVKTRFVQENPLLKSIDPHLDDCEEFCTNVFDSLRNENMELVREFLQVLKQTPPEERSVFSKYLVTVILSCILPENSPIETNVDIVELLVTFFESSEVKYGKSNAFFQRHIITARAGEFHIEAFLLCLKNVILKTKKPSANLSQIDFHEDCDLNRYFVLLANVLFRSSPNHKKYIQFFINYFCKDLKNKLGFMLNLALCNRCPNEEFQLVCVSSVEKLLEYSSQEKDKLLLQEDGILVPYVLALLLSKSEEVKKRVFAVISTLIKSRADSNLYIKLLKNLLEHSEEIVIDNDQIPLIIFNYLSSGNAKEKKTLTNTLIKASCNSNYPLYLKAKILELLSHINTIEKFEETAQDCLDLLKTEPNNLDEIQSSVVISNLLNCQSNIASEIRLNTKAWAVIETCLKRDELAVYADGKKTFATILLLKQFDKEFFAQLHEEVETELLDLIIQTATLTHNSEVLPVIRHIIKIIDLDAKLILAHFTGMRDVQSPKLDQSKLKRRISVVPTIDILDTIQWKKGLTALEFIQEKKKLRNIDVLLPVLFEILKKCLDFDEQAAVEYPKQLILSSILYLGLKADRQDLPENIFNIELIVQCIRASQNPQTHYCALLVLAFSAELFPSQVLHHIMAIFTFMGSSVLRHEDSYSFQIISKIIDTIIPILVKDSTPETIANILRVFVDALLDVPEHRRMPIYEQLLTKIGVDQHLYIFLLLIFESHVNHSSRAKSKDDDMKRLEIAANVCREFSPKVVVQSCIHLMKYLKELPDEIEKDETSPFHIHHKTPKQFRHYKYTLIIFTSKLLSSKEFVNQVASLDDDKALGMEQYYKNMIINVLTYIHRTSKIAEKNAATPHAKYWKVILHLSYDILDSVNALLTPQMFLLVIKGLMTHNINTIRRRSLELLNAKLQSNSSFFSECETGDIYSLIPPLISVIKNIEEPQHEADEELIIQTALLSLKLLVRLLISEYPKKLVEILDFITDIIKSGKAQNNILASVLLCLAELCANLRAHAVPSVPNFMPALLRILKQQKHQESPSLLLLSSITTLQKILETLPLFLSPYLEKLLFELSFLASKWSGEAEDERVQPVVNKLANVRKQIGSVIPPRVLIPALGQSYTRLIDKNAFAAIGPLMDILAENLNCLNGPEITANLPALTDFFLNALQFRSEGRTSFEQTNEVETQIVKALTKLILKLSESTFKPLYYKLFDWAARHEAKTERLITFYSLSSGIAESLKSLFVLFAGHFLNNAAQVLDACNAVKSEALYFDDEEKNVLLLERVLKTLHAVFAYDSHKFVNRDRFQVLMQPLVDQLENTLGGVECLEKRNDSLVTPSIVQFAVATADDALWKQLNYQILLKMKHASPNIRLISLRCLKDMVKQLGVDYLPLLPETIPVLAELLEDEEETVEKACRKAVQEMEKILGEPIEKYFKM